MPVGYIKTLLPLFVFFAVPINTKKQRSLNRRITTHNLFTAMRISALLFAFWLAPLCLFAQDIRISPQRPILYSFPSEYRIQSADAIGDRTLAVWGTSRSIASNTVVGELRYQVLDGSDLLGSQGVLTDTAARPSGFVQVIAGSTFFVVFWNDVREGASGLYAQRVDLNGVLLGKGTRISPGFVLKTSVSSGILTFGEGDRLLVWQDNRADSAGLYAMHLEKSGGLVVPAQRVANVLKGLFEFADLPNTSFLRTTDTTALMIHSNNRIDQREVKWPRDGLLYTVGPDTSLATLSGKHLTYYSSIFIKSPDWTTDVSALDSAAGQTGMLSRDSVGGVQLTFLVVEVTGTYPAEGRFRVSTYRTNVLALDSFSLPATLYEEDHINGFLSGSGNGGYSIYRKAAFGQGCDNSELTILSFETIPYTHGSPSQEYEYTYKYSVDPEGTFHNDSTGYIASCLPDLPVQPSRGSLGTLSTIVLSVAGKSVTLSAPTAEVIRSAYQARPLLLPSAGENAICYWYDNLRGNNLLYKTPLPFTGIATQVSTFQIPELISAGVDAGGTADLQWCAKIPLESNSGSIIPPGFIAYYSNQRVLCGFLRHVSNTDVQFTGYQHNFDLYFPGDTSWVGFVRHISSPTGIYPEYHQLQSGALLGYDFEHRQVLITLNTSQRNEPYDLDYSSLVALNAQGKVAWSVDTISLKNYGTLLPVDSLRYLSITDTSATLYRKKAIVATYALPLPGSGVQYQGLLGPRFLRSSWLDNHTALYLEAYDAIDGLIARQTLPVVGSLGNISIVQRPSDSALAVLWGTGANGIHVALLDKNLNIVMSDAVISNTRDKATNPSGLFRRDTLYVVWEDYRQGEVSIYGTGFFLSPARTLVVEREDNREEILNVRLSPNPAHESARVEFSHPVGKETELRLYDLLGNLVWQIRVPVGSASAIVPTEGQAAGAYRLWWRSGESSGSLPVVW